MARLESNAQGHSWTSTGNISNPAALAIIAVLSSFWLQKVNEYVPEPYMDEVFHIPQAQNYCNWNFHIWDAKLTTPPGLYLFSILQSLLFNVVNFSCTAGNLRSIGPLALTTLVGVAIKTRSLIGLHDSKIAKIQEGLLPESRTWSIAHTALNIALFPPLFFFSGLYYTDVVSTLVVILAYYFFLTGTVGRNVLVRGVITYLVGITALFMRQTNIFWVAVFLAGLEWIRACKESDVQRTDNCWQANWLLAMILPFQKSHIHDRLLNQASVVDFFWCAVTVASSALCNPLLLISRLWPYFALLISFAGFVFWNGGVVLGDKSNHVATIHLPQMLYIWPFIAFFSAPRLLPYVLQHLVSLLSPPQTGTSSKVLAHMTQNRLTGFCLFSSCAIALVIVHYNTIIHPFTLSDNRHYMFYIFRYTILRHWLVKYLAVPLYVACGWLVLKCLAGFTSSEPSRLGNKTRQSKSVSKVATFSGPSQAESQSANSTTTSFTLIFLLTTALSLITAPLVEPRYFIIPWVIWRLNVPALPVKSSPNAGAPKSGIIPALNWLFEERTLLWLETIQFLVINVVTGYMFLFKGFSWESELGRVQRFMW